MPTLHQTTGEDTALLDPPHEVVHLQGLVPSHRSLLLAIQDPGEGARTAPLQRLALFAGGSSCDSNDRTGKHNRQERRFLVRQEREGGRIGRMRVSDKSCMRLLIPLGPVRLTPLIRETSNRHLHTKAKRHNTHGCVGMYLFAIAGRDPPPSPIPTSVATRSGATPRPSGTARSVSPTRSALSLRWVATRWAAR